MKLYVKTLDGYRPATTNDVVECAKRAINRKYRRGRAFSRPDAVREYLQIRMGAHRNEVFAALWLDTRHQLIAYEELFQGTVDGTSVHPRVVVQRALELNVAAVIFAHPHPSGVAEPSHADEAITRRLRDALSLVEIRLLDHIIVGHTCVSMAERGLI